MSELKLNPDRDKKVDYKHLEWEWFRQSQLYYDYAEAQADAEQEKLEAKLKLDVVKAEAEQKIRENPDKYGSTNPAVNAAVVLNKKVIKATKRYFLKIKTDKVLVGMLRTMEHRKRTLEKADERKAGNFYSEPRAPKWARDQLEKEQGKKVRKKLKRRKDGG